MSFKILIAEDEEITLKQLLSTLQKEGWEAAGVKDGNRAFQEISSGHFDLLIADIKMPGLSGIEILDRKKGKYPATEVIIITGFGSIGSAVEAMRKGHVIILQSPLILMN